MYRLCIQVVGWFIEQEHIWLLQKQTAEGHTSFFTTRKVGYIRFGWRKTQGIHGFVEHHIELPSIYCIQFLLHFPLTGDELVHGIWIVHEGRIHKLFIDFFKFLEQGNSTGYRFLHNFLDSFGGIQLRFLLQHSYRVAW